MPLLLIQLASAESPLFHIGMGAALRASPVGGGEWEGVFRVGWKHVIAIEPTYRYTLTQGGVIFDDLGPAEAGVQLDTKTEKYQQYNLGTLLRIGLPINGTLEWEAIAGGLFSYERWAYLETDRPKETYKTTTFGLDIGIGMTYPLAKHLSIGTELLNHTWERNQMELKDYGDMQIVNTNRWGFDPILRMVVLVHI